MDDMYASLSLGGHLRENYQEMVSANRNNNEVSGNTINMRHNDLSSTNGSSTNGVATNGHTTKDSPSNGYTTNGNAVNGCVRNEIDERKIEEKTKNIDTRHQEPIAIIGMGCRLPGGATSPSKFWDLLIEGRSGHCEMPQSRFNAEGFYHHKSEHPVSVNSTGGYFLQDDPRLFDNSFFGINNLEATYMDPQQRQLLEVVFECFESAGATLEQLSGKNVGCYVANFLADFVVMQSKDPELFHRYSATGMGLTILANRISNIFNLTGPSFVLDTACSSSLYALHTACSALRMGECESAVVAGANLVQTPELHLMMVKAGFLSPTSTCHTFDVSADGYGRGEGVGVLYLKRLSDAIRDGDSIRSVIRGTAVNSNGHTNGITLPSVAGQEAVIRKAYEMAGLPADETDYVEAHGTGTPVGDPIEVEALSRVFSHKSGQPTLIGSVKTNLGHSEAVSGISSIIKVTMALESGIIPPTIGITKLNPALKLNERNMQVVMSKTTWPESNIRRASVNSFGYGGANAHVILEAASAHVPEALGPSRLDIKREGKLTVLPFSATSKPALLDKVKDINLFATSGVSNVDIASTLTNHRSLLLNRGYLITENDSTSCKVQQTWTENIRTTESDGKVDPSPIAFVFTGQGAQWPRMGHELFETFPVYRQSIRTLDSYLRKLAYAPSWTIEDALLEPVETSDIHKASHSQTVGTAIQIALVELLRDWNVVPEAVVGHSSGEISAAFAAGHLTAEEALAIAYYRGLACARAPANGAMAAVGIDKEASDEEIAALGLQDQIRVACVNSPSSSTISGDSEAIDEIVGVLQDKGIFARKLKTGNKAYHSHHMLLVGQAYEDFVSLVYAKRISANSEARGVQMFSSVTGHLGAKKLIDSPQYWRRNLESPVLFSDSIKDLLNDKPYHLIEIGPHSALQQPIKQVEEAIEGRKISSLYIPTLLRGKDAERSLLDLAGNLFLHKHPISLNKVNQLSSSSDGQELMTKCKILHDFPTYHWNHQVLLWSESRTSTDFRNREIPRHDLLGSRVVGIANRTAQWRNILRVQELPWLEDHRLGTTMVFPGAGYLALATEALSQVSQSAGLRPTGVSFRDVHILNVLVLQDEKVGVEIFTEIQPQQISGASTSGEWWQFEITSVVDNSSTIHASGMIAVRHEEPNKTDRFFFSAEDLEEQATRTWYDKLAKEGLRFGPSFRSLTKLYNDRSKSKCRTVAETTLMRGGASAGGHQSGYMVHPITLDALLQTAIIASAAGSVPRLRGKVPVTIGTVEMSIDPTILSSDQCMIYADSEDVGFGTININAELRSPQERVVARVSNVRAISYEEGALEMGTDPADERNPVLRVLWKPDFATLSQEHAPQLTAYIDRFAHEIQNIVLHDSDMGRFGGAVDLLTHWNARLHILELSVDDDFECRNSSWLFNLMHAGTPLKRFQAYTTATVSKDGKLSGCASFGAGQIGKDVEIKSDEVFDAILIPRCSSMTLTQQALKYLAPNGHLLFASTYPAQKSIHESFEATQFQVISTELTEARCSITIARRLAVSELKPAKPKAQPSVILVYRHHSHRFTNALLTQLSEYFQSTIDQISLENITQNSIPSGSIVISTLELQDPILENANQDEIEQLKAITDNASTLIWITGGSLFKSERPSFSIVCGLARSIMLEQPSLKMFVVDLEDATNNPTVSAGNIMSVLDQALHSSKPEFEYIQHNGVLYSSRFIPEEAMNKRFRQGQNSEAVLTPLRDASQFQLSIRSAGQLDSLHFIQSPPNNALLESGFVEVRVQAVGLNAKDFYVLHGKVDTKNSTCACEFSGIVTQVGSSRSRFKAGDRVVVMAPTHFASLERVPEWACYPLEKHEDFTTCSTIPLVFSTALYALENRSQLQRGESILIHSAAGGLGLAAIQIATLIGAEIFATVGTEEKREFLVKNFDIKPDHIFSSRDSSFLPGILAATSGRGVDVVLNSLTGDLLHDSWRACAEFGRFVEVGKRDIVDSGKLDMTVFGRGVTFTAFDLSSLFWSKDERQHKVWASLIEKTMVLYREGNIKAIEPLKIFDVTEIVQAFRYFALGTRIGKVAVSLESKQSLIPLVPLKYKTILSTDKAYILIGCLGGLGRSLSKWMFSRGARKFVFIGRSGTDRAPARSLVEDLQKTGANVTVIRGNVSSAEDVERAISEVQDPIGGVVHAAMGLDLALFTEITSKVWHGGIEQKVQGAWNLHNALSKSNRSQYLDFFLCTSSISGSIGVATEANYCAANCFLDAFARYRRSLGLPCTSLGLGMISEVGYLHENPEIEALLLRKGVHPLNEDELLQLVDIALSPESTTKENARDIPDFSHDHFGEGHILTGLELLGLQKIRAMGWERPTQVLDDPRTAIIAGAYAAAAAAGDNSEDAHAESSNGLPKAVSTALAAHAPLPLDPSENEQFKPEEPLILAIQSVVATKIGALLLVGTEELAPDKQLADFGMDSMLAAEFRGAMFRVFHIDVPFATLLDKRTCVRSLGELLAKRLLVTKV
ncbi:ketoacyl-synt-domain-containing protein [Tricladium varicosporioides]|nr:ketoacyl-synt-domain-containing protein [Hymenoscyphus varicosporioides]